MASIFDAAKYILEQRGRTPVLKLQKLLYYAQAWSLVLDHAPLFPEDFEAWPNGPMYPLLHWLFEDQFDITAEDITGNSACLTGEQKDTINSVLKVYGAGNIRGLTRLSMEEEPWIQARNGLPPDEPSSTIIPKETFIPFYSSQVA